VTIPDPNLQKLDKVLRRSITVQTVALWISIAVLAVPIIAGIIVCGVLVLP